MAWVDVEVKLPEPGVEVVVYGDYTPESVPLPRARLNSPERARDWGPWSSAEWRGTMAIRFWWEDSVEAAGSRKRFDLVGHNILG